MESLIKETDRGCALIASAFLDERLLELLQARAVEAATSEKFASFFKNEGPLATFSARIKAAYLYGFIGQNVYRDLDYVRKIRNEFAHDPEHLSFRGQQIKDWCAQLRDYLILKIDHPRIQFIMAAMALEMILDLAITDAKRSAVAPDISDNAFLELAKRGAIDLEALRADLKATNAD
jgi:DNA-binding MltR family transcriptional regulator